MSKTVNDENYLCECLDKGLRQTCLYHYKQPNIIKKNFFVELPIFCRISFS